VAILNIMISANSPADLLRNLGDEYDVSVVSPHNYFLFSPLLTSVAVGTNEDRSVVEPIRSFCRRKRSPHCITFYEAKATSVDVKNGKVVCEHISQIPADKKSFELEYDKLVVAGASGATRFRSIVQNVIILLFLPSSWRQVQHIRCSRCGKTCALPEDVT
jgi:NADH:ubiquinone reductase (non-electrogenic)